MLSYQLLGKVNPKTMNDEQELVDTQQTTEAEPEAQEQDVEAEMLTPEQIADLKRKAEVSSQNYERAKRAEQELKRLRDQPKDQPSQKDSNALSPKDLYAMQVADVHIDDFDEIEKAAKFFGSGDIAKGLKSPAVEALLEKKAAFRKTAEASNTTKAKPGTKATSDEQLLKDVSTGKVPDAGSAEAERLFWLRRGVKK